MQVLYFTEPIDEVAAQQLGEYDGKKLVDVSREGLDLGGDDDKKQVGLLCFSSCSVCVCVFVPRITRLLSMHTSTYAMCLGA